MEKEVRRQLADYRRGKAEALAPLVEMYRRPLFGFILRMTEGRDDAEEIFQEVWFRAIKNLGHFRQARLLSWLFRIAHNLVIDRARKAKPQVDMTGRAEDPETSWVHRIPAVQIGPAHELVDADLGRRIREAVQKLPLEQREVFLMRMEGDLPFRDIARIQQASINTVLARMQYALAKLRAALKDEYRSVRSKS